MPPLSPAPDPPSGRARRALRRAGQRVLDRVLPLPPPGPGEELASLVAARAATRSAYHALLRRRRAEALAAPVGTEERRTRREHYLAALRAAELDELIHQGVPMLARSGPLVAADSFWRSILQRRRKKQLGRVPERYLGIAKADDQEFARGLGVPTATTLWEGSFAQLAAQVQPGTVVKPMVASGSAGVFYVFARDRIVSVATTEQVDSVDGLLATARQQVAKWGGADQQTWQVQELVLGPDGEPARDLKFYSFYGKIGMIVEIVRFPSVGYAYFNADLQPIRSGKDHLPRFAEGVATRVDTGGVTEAMFEQVRALSLEVPAPFLRMDFHHGADELVFCEFSAAPGHSDLLPRRYDRVLGRMYHRAELRLTEDLLAGKSFQHLRAFNEAQWERRNAARSAS